MLTSAVELLKKAVNLYLNNFTAILKYLLLTLIPTLIIVLTFWVLVVFGESFYLAMLAGWWWLFVLTGVVIATLVFGLGMWFSFNLMRVIKKLYHGETLAPVMATTKETEKVLWKGIGTSLLAGLYTAGPFVVGALLLVANRVVATYFSPALPAAALSGLSGTMANLVGTLTFYLGWILAIYGAIHAIVFSIKLFPAVYETVLAEKPIKESIKNALAITKNRWWAILGRLLLSGIVVWLAYVIASLLLSLIISALLKIFDAMGGAIINLTYSILTQILSLLITPVPFAVAIILYEELKKLGPAQKT